MTVVTWGFRVLGWSGRGRRKPPRFPVLRLFWHEIGMVPEVGIT